MHEIREEYKSSPLLKSDLKENPVDMLNEWYQLAVKNDLKVPNSASLATSLNNIPQVRIILIKDIQDKGITFYTNYSSNKANEIAQNSNACLNFYWKEFDRQVRVTGSLTKTSRENSESYFHSRPIESQISAYISNQSSVVEDYNELLSLQESTRKEFENKVIPCPENWGGYLLVPNTFEFWQGRPHRLHDRFCFEKVESQSWKVSRLAP